MIFGHFFRLGRIWRSFGKIFQNFFRKTLDKSDPLWYNIVVPLMSTRENELICWCGSMAEHLICNQAVDGSTPFTSSIFGGFPERPKGADCKSVVTDFGGPNPPSPTKKLHRFAMQFFYPSRQAWYIIAAQRAVHIISPFGAVYHHAIARILCRLDEIQTFGLMIYSPSD